MIINKYDYTVEDREKSYLQRLIYQVLEIMKHFKEKKCTIEEMQGVIEGNSTALDNTCINIKDKLEGFVGACDRIIYTIDDDKQRDATLKLIEKYEPYIYELLKVDR